MTTTKVKEAVVELLPEDPPKALPKPKRGDNLKAYQFQKGVSGNPGGRPQGARNTLTGNFLKCLSEDFEKHGQKTISRARNKDPLGYVKVVANLLPRQMEKVQPLDDMTDAELSAGIALLRSKLSVDAISPSPRQVTKKARKGTGETQESQETC